MSKNAPSTKAEIVSGIHHHHDAFLSLISALDQGSFDFSWKEKWTPGQQLEHITKSVAPLVLAMRLPRFVLKYKFGVTNRPSRTYDELVARYHKALEGLTAAAPKEFSPKAAPYSTRKQQFTAYEKVVKKLAKVAEKCSDRDLDYYVVPHPLMGKVTLREILFFSIYHVQHHHKITEEIIHHYK